MGVVDRLIRRLPSHPHPPKLKEVPKVLPQVTGVPVRLSSLRASHSPTGLYNDCKRSEADGPDKGNQTSPVPGRLAYQGPVSGRSTSEHSDSGRSDSVLRVDNKSGEIRTKTCSSVFIRGLRIPSRFSPCKTHSRQIAQTSGFDPTTQVKICFDCKIFDVANWVACFNGGNGPGGTPSYEALSVSPQGALEISSVIGQPPSLERNHFSAPRVVANPTNVMKGSDLHPKDHSIQLFTDASNEGWGAHLEQTSTKGLWSDREKRLHINVLEMKAVSLALQSFKNQCQNQTVFVATDNSTVVANIYKQGGTHSAEMCALLWKITTWCHHYQITIKARHIPGCLNVMADLLSRSNQVQSTEWSLHSQVLKQICHKWFTSHVDLFATRLNHKLPLYVSPIPDQNAWDIDALNINWSGLTAYASPPTALLHRVIQKKQAIQLSDHCNSPRLARDALVLGPSAALNKDPTSTTSVKVSSQTVSRLCVSQQSTTSPPPRLVSRSGQLQEQGFSVDVAERIAASQRSSTRTIYKSKWSLFEKCCRENSVDFSTPSVKQVSTVSCTNTKT